MSDLEGNFESAMTEITRLRTESRGENQNMKNYIQFLKAMHRQVFQTHDIKKTNGLLSAHLRANGAAAMQT